MVSRSLSGVSQPIHCQHNTHAEPSTAFVTACELNECSGSPVVATLSSHPAFECIHLKSVKYVLPYQQPVTLTETSLDDLAGPKLACLKESRKKSLSLEERGSSTVHFQHEANNFTSNHFWCFFNF